MSTSSARVELTEHAYRLNGRVGCSATTQRLKVTRTCSSSSHSQQTELGYDCYHHAAPYFNSDNWHKERIDYFFVGGEGKARGEMN